MLCKEEAMTVAATTYCWDQFDADVFAAAEKELAAFTAAVKQTFGVFQERQAVEDWLSELNASEPSMTGEPHWRQISIAAAARLAQRVCLLR